MAERVAAAFKRDKAISLGRVEPLDRAFYRCLRNWTRATVIEVCHVRRTPLPSRIRPVMRPTSGMVRSAPNIMRKTGVNPQRGRRENGDGIRGAEPQALARATSNRPVLIVGEFART